MSHLGKPIRHLCLGYLAWADIMFSSFFAYYYAILYFKFKLNIATIRILHCLQSLSIILQGDGPLPIQQ